AETGTRPDTLAYPYGFQDDRVVRATRQHYLHACTVEFRRLRKKEDPHRLPRLDAYYFQTPGTLESWGTWKFSAYLTARSAGRSARRMLEGAGLLKS
ncbi:MAG: hypothetical protein HKN12_11460, partial [Gemmatimonadetes bacterium]|nr:hypothetical protein [Gemmatimonadota bacterium]